MTEEFLFIVTSTPNTYLLNVHTIAECSHEPFAEVRFYQDCTVFLHFDELRMADLNENSF